MTLPYEGINTPFSSISKEANNHTRPKCASCSTPEYPVFFNRVEGFGVGNNELRWVCVGCSRNISEEEINYAEDNLNAPFRGQLSPSDLLKQQEEQQQKLSQREHRFANSIAAARPRITNGLGATTYTTSINPDGPGGGGATSSSSDSGHSFLQGFDPRENLIRERRGSSRDRNRTPGATIPTKDLHQLDRSLHNEYPGIQIREVQEMPRTAPTDKAIVSKNTRDKVRSYPRYSEDSSNDKDPYDNV